MYVFVHSSLVADRFCCDIFTEETGWIFFTCCDAIIAETLRNLLISISFLVTSNGDACVSDSVDDCKNPSALKFICSDPTTAEYCRKSCKLCGN